MKKSRKVLSVFLAMVVAFASMPLVYTATAVPEVRAATMTGTIDNPTKNIKKEGNVNREDLYKVNVSVAETSYHFYQTIDDEYFTYTQSVGLQQVTSGASDRTVMFDSVSDYTGGSNVDGNAEGVSVGTQGYYENPVITDNKTADFIKNASPISTWNPINENAKDVDDNNINTAPANFKIDGSTFDFSGCRVYTWHNTVVFKGSPKGSSIMNGEHTFYRSYKHHWDANDGSSHAAMDARIGTTVEIVDARQLYNELLKIENILSYPAKYTDAYISSVTATYNSIPEDLRDFSGYYTQAQVDAYTKAIKDISKNSADYSVYNQYMEEIGKLDNHTGAWSNESFAHFKKNVADIDAALPKNLDKTQQYRVDEAIQALVNAYNGLVSADLSGPSTGEIVLVESSEDNGYYRISVDKNNFKFMQIRDDQLFQISQRWTLSKHDGSNDRYLSGGIVLDTPAEGVSENSSKSTCLTATPSDSVKQATKDFITNHFLNSKIDNKSVVQLGAQEVEWADSSFNPYEFDSWWEEGADGVINIESSIIDEGPVDEVSGTVSGTINRGFGYGNNGKEYYLRNKPVFTGMDANTTGEQTYTFSQRAGWKWETGNVGSIDWFAKKYGRHVHITSTVTITDVRQLIATEAQAQQILANPDGYSDSYISALQAAVNSVPLYMLHGSEYYTQAEVDACTNAIASVMANPNGDYADYTDFNTVFARMAETENEGKYTPSSFDAFQKAIYEINTNLPKDLPASEQETVDNAVRALFAAEQNLQYRHLNQDEEFSDTDITDSLGNNPVAFTVSSTDYKFMQTHDGQEFVIKTDMSLRNTRSSYKSKLLSLKISQLDASTLSVCANRESPDTGCHYGENVLRNDYQSLLNSITNGLNVFSTANEAGDIAEFNTWVNNYGTALTSGGIISDGVQLSGSDSSASAIMTYTGATGGAQNMAATELRYALRLGWSYQEVVLGVEGESISRHAHIPVTLTITDARALSTLYKESLNAILGKTEETYTLATLEALYAALITVPEDMAYGESYYTQEQVNEAYQRLNSAYSTLKEGADYSEYFAECVNVDAVISSNNEDGYGNKLYSQDAYDEYVATVTQITSTLDKNLDATPENQATIDAATQALKDAKATLEENKYADYSKYGEVLKKAEDIVNAPEGTYTEATVNATQQAIDQANKTLEDAAAAAGTDKNQLPVSSQPAIDSATDVLQNAVEESLYKLDYADYEKALADALAVKNEPQVYTNSAYAEYLETLAEIDAGIDKDLPDYEVNRQILRDAIAAIDAAKAELENNKLGDYSEYDKEKAESDAIVNDDGNGNEIYNPTAFEEFKNTVENIDNNLNRDLPASQQSVIDTATQGVKDAQQTLEENKWADYSQLEANKALVQEILNKEAEAPGTYTQATIDAANQAMNTANAIQPGMVVGKDNVNQNAIDSAADGLQSVLDNAKEKADYSVFEDALAKVEEILNAPEGTYTDSTVQAAQAAKDAADALDKDLPKDNQADIDAVTDAMNQVADNAQIKADYSEFNEVKAELEEIINAPEGTYTDATLNAAQEALNQAENLDKDLPVDNQADIDAVTDAMQNVIDNAQEKADYTEYNDKKAELEEVIAGGNTDPVTGENIYAPEIFEKLQENLDNVDNNLNKDLPKTEQETVDNATDTIQNLLDSKLYTAIFVDGETQVPVQYTGGTLLKDIVGKPALPADTGDYKYVGWKTANDANGNFVFFGDETPVKGDVTLYPAGELTKITPNADSSVTIDAVEGYATGIDKGTSVEELKAELQNDEICIEVIHYTGTELAGVELVGTGSKIILKSKYTGTIYEQRDILIYGDVDGDGDVDDDDYSKARTVNVGDATEEYTIDGSYREYFFLANDLNGDGYIDVLDSSLLALVKNGKIIIK